MSKKRYIIALLMFAYTIVLGHNIVPHGHFDDLFLTQHTHDSNDHHDSHHDSDHEHYSFSHSVTLHVSIEKQTVFTANISKLTTKKAPSNNLHCIPVTYKPDIVSSFAEIIFSCYTQPPIKVCSTSIPSRAPPASMS